jgi:hypothetical protein
MALPNAGFNRYTRLLKVLSIVLSYYWYFYYGASRKSSGKNRGNSNAGTSWNSATYDPLWRQGNFMPRCGLAATILLISPCIASDLSTWIGTSDWKCWIGAVPDRLSCSCRRRRHGARIRRFRAQTHEQLSCVRHYPARLRRFRFLPPRRTQPIVWVTMSWPFWAPGLGEMQNGRVSVHQSCEAGRVEDWRGVPKVWPSLLLPVSVGSASIAEP